MERIIKLIDKAKMIKFENREEFFETLRHFFRIGELVTDRLELPDFSFNSIYYTDEYTGYILEMSDDGYFYKILIPYQFWDMSISDIEKVLDKIPKDKFKMKNNFLDLKNIVNL